MKERSERLRSIKKLIKNNRIESQDELLRELTKEGFDVTQATLPATSSFLRLER